MTAVSAESMLTAALGYLVRRWFPIPLCWPDANGACGCGRGHAAKDVGKAPLVSWKPLVKTPPTEGDMTEWWSKWPIANIGLLLEPSRLLIVDLDSAEALQEAARLGLPPGPVVASGKGEHHYYQAAPGLTGSTTKRGGSRAIDILASGYVVAPPSAHRSGRVYSWLVSPEAAP